MIKNNWVLSFPSVRIITTLMLCFLLLNPYINDEYFWRDTFTIVVYIIVCIYLLAKCVYQSFFEK